jgi:ATP-dependent Clp protease ATP-binding subunit ClpA
VLIGEREGAKTGITRTIQRRVLHALVLHVLQGEFVDGDTVVVEVSNRELVFEKRSVLSVR